MKFKADKEGGNVNEVTKTVQPSTKKAMQEVKRIEKAVKMQEKIIAKKHANTEKAKLKNDEELIKKVKSEEDAAIAVLKRIRADKERAETELKNAIAGQKGEHLAASDSATNGAISDAREAEEEVTMPVAVDVSKQDTEEGNYSEKYPVNEPYAYVEITATSPPIYHISEVSLTRGEEELLEEIKTRLYETLDVSFVSTKDAELFIEQKAREIIKEFAL